ncbi:MAG: sensor histidine kinase [Gemmatimonadales bacterium]|nr:MAG: sensor histidine kinase [Gemmatimonadales bacterium]
MISRCESWSSVLAESVRWCPAGVLMQDPGVEDFPTRLSARSRQMDRPEDATFQGLPPLRGTDRPEIDMSKESHIEGATGSRSGSAPRRETGVPGWLARPLRAPLTLKIVVANSVLAVAAAGWGALVAPTLSDPQILAWGSVGLLALVALNWALVHLALRPLRDVELAARRVEDGDLDTTITLSPLADRSLQRLTGGLNSMLGALATSRARQRELSARLLDAEELERKRISHELLDETAQLLSSMLLQLKLVARCLPSEAAGSETSVYGCHAALEGARREARSALEGIQRIARGLRPPELDELGVRKAIEAHLRQRFEGTGIAVSVEGGDPDALLAPDQSLVLYRVVQEAVANALGHAHPSTVVVRIGHGPDAVEVEIEDDGVGFDPGKVAGNGVGLLRMHERARFAGGTLEVDSRRGAGTRLRLELPRTAPRD